MVPSLGGRSAVAVLVTFVATVAAAARAAEHAAAGEMRVQSTVFRTGEEKAMGRSLALFTNHVVWDFVEMPAEAEDAPPELAEIVLHDPLRERIVLVDPKRSVKVEVDHLTLARLRVSLAAWARGTDDNVIRWTGSHDLARSIAEDGETFVLDGPDVGYVVSYEDAPSPEAARAYQQFADSSLLLRALLHPGGLPPFPRMAINARLAKEDKTPREVRLRYDQRLPLVPELPGISREKGLRSEHRIHPRLLAEDRKRIADASARIAEATTVTLEAYADSGSDPTSP
jgi:hypothetical protein